MLANQARKRLANVDEAGLHQALAQLEGLLRWAREGDG